MAKEPSFIADTMLGEVARWLRILGYDVLYSKNYSDSQIIRIAEKTGRIILTRDLGLYNLARKKGLPAVYVSTDRVEERLAEVAWQAGIDLRLDPSRSRCPYCNAKLVEVRDKDIVRDRVPPGALRTYDVFYVCPRCGRVYWVGGHWKNMKRVVDEANRILEVVRSAAKARRPGRA